VPAPGNRVLLWVERGLLGAGVVLLAVWAVARLEGEAGRRAGLARFEAHRAAVAPRSLKTPDRVDRRLWSEQRVRAYEAIRGQPLAPPLAVLRVPGAGIEVPVLPGTDEATLNRAVGWIDGTARPGEPGNVGIAGHRDGFFRGLKDLAVGDRITLETVQRTEEYVIEDITIVTPDEVAVLEPTRDPTLTLVTCYPFYFVGDAPKRFIVRALATRPGSPLLAASR
jgi:sortase A